VTARFNPDHAGVGEMLRADFMQNAMRMVADQILVRAEAIAPVGHPPGDKHPGRYKASFHVRVHARGGATHDRAEAVVYNDSPEALYVEYASYGQEPYRVLARAAFGRINRK
jgi:hypothetical protein